MRAVLPFVAVRVTVRVGRLPMAFERHRQITPIAEAFVV
jgi:hypothetical protein